MIVLFISHLRGIPHSRNKNGELTMTTASLSNAFPATATATRTTWLARVLAALDRACASSAEGARGF